MITKRQREVKWTIIDVRSGGSGSICGRDKSQQKRGMRSDDPFFNSGMTKNDNDEPESETLILT